MDRLKQYIIDNREQLDAEVAPAKGWDGVNNKLLGRSRIRLFIRYAAAVCVVAGIGFGIVKFGRNDKGTVLNVPKNDTVAVVKAKLDSAKMVTVPAAQKKKITRSLPLQPEETILISNSKLLTIKVWDNNFTQREGGDTAILYIPSGHPVNVTNVSGRLTITDYIKELSIVNENGAVKIKNAKNLSVKSKGGSFTADSIANGDLRFHLTRVKMGLLRNGIWNSESTSSEIGELGEVRMNSTKDEMKIARVFHIEGEKNSGSLQIDFLVRKLDLEGSYASIRIQDMNPKAELVKIENTNGYLQLPLSKLTAYTVAISGGDNSLYGSFAPRMQQQNSESGEEIRYYAAAGEGKLSRIQLVCTNSKIGLH